MEQDESRALAVEELQGGEARVRVGAELSVSREICNGYWLGAKSYVTVEFNCPQEEGDIITATNIAEEMALEKVYEMTSAAQQRIDEISEEERNAKFRR